MTATEKRLAGLCLFQSIALVAGIWINSEAQRKLSETNAKQAELIELQSRTAELLTHNRMSKEPKITRFGPVRLYKDGRPARDIWEATIDQGDGRVQFAEFVGDAKKLADFMDEKLKGAR